MKQIVFISGKGGTGKSTIVASLSLLVNNKMLADCDVDAPNLHLMVRGELIRQKDYSGAKIARINLEECVNCGMCRQVCRFDAITENYSIRPMACEGCAACQVLCPTDAIELIPVKTGETYVTKLIGELSPMPNWRSVLKALGNWSQQFERVFMNTSKMRNGS